MYKTFPNNESPNLSAALVPSMLDRKINSTDADIIHLHWVCQEMISIESIGRIKKPIVWTMHDMWPFLGVDHYLNKSCNQNRGRISSVLDNWVKSRKLRNWKQPIHFIAPSSWLGDCAKKSEILQCHSIQQIPYALPLKII